MRVFRLLWCGHLVAPRFEGNYRKLKLEAFLCISFTGRGKKCHAKSHPKIEAQSQEGSFGIKDPQSLGMSEVRVA